MYIIQKTDQLSSTKQLVTRTFSLGLGITFIQFYVELWKIFHLLRNVNGNGKEPCIIPSIYYPSSPTTGSARDDHQRSEYETCATQGQMQIFHHDLTRYLIIGAFLYAQLFVGLVDLYLFSVIRTAMKKESISDGWLGLNLQISLLTYNMMEILMVAYHGIFDGSSMILAARTTVRAMSIEIICLFLRQIQEKQDNDFVLYTKIFLV